MGEETVSNITKVLGGEMKAECLVCDKEVDGKNGLVVEVVNAPEGLGVMLIHDNTECHAKYAHTIDAHLRDGMMRMHRRVTSEHN